MTGNIDEALMQRYLNAEHDDPGDWHTPETGIYHSSQSGKCVRNWYFTRKEDIRPDRSAYKHFELGNVLEDVFKDALIEEFGSRYVKTDIPISIDLGDCKIVGETDPVVVNDNNEIRMLTECKTTKNLKYTKASPKHAHIAQVHCYMSALGLDECKIVYINKTNLQMQVHRVEFDAGIYNGIVDRTKEVHQALQDEEPPEKQPEEAHDHFCNAGDRCCKNQ